MIFTSQNCSRQFTFVRRPDAAWEFGRCDQAGNEAVGGETIDETPVAESHDRAKDSNR